MKRIKVVVVGDGAVGKTCLLISFKTKEFHMDYLPTMLDIFEYNKLYEGEHFAVGIWDTYASDETDGLRPRCYPQTDVFIICYSIIDRKSFENVRQRWIPEINGVVRNVPFIVVATKSDLKSDSNVPKVNHEEFINKEEGLEMAKSIGAFGFIEVSSKTYDNVDKVFDQVIEIYKHKKPLINSKIKQKGCFIC